MNENEFCGNRKIAVKVLTGSHNYNLNIPASDKDYKYFVYPSFEDLYAGKMFANSLVSETLDATCHDVRQLVELVWKANLNFIEVLYSIERTSDPVLDFIFNARDALATMNLFTFFKATYGMHLMKMKDLKKGTGNTTCLVEKYGYDTKQACHAYRCLLVLSRFMKFDSIGNALWFSDDDEDKYILLDIKAGNFSEEGFLHLVGAWHAIWKNACEEFYRDSKPNEKLYKDMQNELRDVVKEIM
jgi:hypothetical protein